MTTTNSKAAQGLEAFLKHSLDGGGGDWVGNWKDNGELVFWIHPDSDLGNASQFTHAFFKTRTYDARDDEPETTKVKWFKFVCCDPDRTAGASRWYEKDGYRQNPPIVCPIDFMLEWTSVEIASGRLDWKTPVFEFTGDEPKGDRLLRAGGMLGLFSRNDLTKDEQSDLRKGRVDISQAFQQDLRSRGGYLLAVIDDVARESVQKFAIQGTGNPLKSLPGMFKGAIQAVLKGYKVDDPNTGRQINIPPADPTQRPYRFQYLAPPNDPKTGRSKGFGEYKVYPLNRQPDEKIRELMALPCPNLGEDRAKGNCPELLMIMKQHCVLPGMPIESFFEAADKAGLMRPRDEKPKKSAGRSAHEVRGANPTTASSVQALTVECLNCGKGMPTDDLTCGSCGATYDQEGDLDGLPCLKCKTVVDVSDDSAGRVICPKCATIHSLNYVDDAKRASGKRPVWEMAKIPGEDATDDDPESSEAPGGDDLPY